MGFAGVGKLLVLGVARVGELLALRLADRGECGGRVFLEIGEQDAGVVAGDDSGPGLLFACEGKLRGEFGAQRSEVAGEVVA